MQLGGSPRLDRAESWPTRDDGKPLSFLLQLDLEEVARVAPDLPLPTEGTLSLFYDDAEQPWGFRPSDRTGHRVVWSRGPLMEVPAPSGVRVFEPQRLTVERFDDPAPAFDVSPDEEDALETAREELWITDEAIDLKVLGHPNEVQGPMELECQLASNGIDVGTPKGYEDPRATALAAGAAEWRLLLQVGSVGDVMWGDLGRLYVWIREPDLRAGRFDRTWLVLQCT